MSLLFSWLFADFLIIFALITILGSVHRPCEQYPNIITTMHIFFLILLLFLKWKCNTFHIWHFFSSSLVTEYQCHSGDQTPSTVPLHVNDSLGHIYSFLPALSWFFSYICINYYIWKWAQTTSTVPQHCQEQSILCLLLFPIFSDFQAILGLITIFRNMHRPHQQYPNTINNSFNHVYSLLSDFTAIFISITIFGKVHRPCKKYPNIVTNTDDQHHPFFSDFITGPWHTKSSGSCVP